MKHVYGVALDAFKPAKLGGELPVVAKTMARDRMSDLKSVTNGYLVDKVEGSTVDANGRGCCGALINALESAFPLQ